MANNSMGKIIQHLQRTALLRDGAGLTDGQLLERYLLQGEDAAFTALVRRHASMVMNVCSRILGNDHDAEDAFQASFLVLVRKADSIVPRERVGNFLYGVAYTTARRAKGRLAKQRVREKQVAEMPEATAKPQSFGDDLRPLLDLELSRLPDKYRTAIVLCDLEETSIKEAARQLGWPQGTLAGRLARGRVMLAKRLARHGLSVSGGVLATLLSQQARSALVPMRLLSATTETAKLFAKGKAASALISSPVAALTKGVVKTMLLSKVKMATASLILTAASFAALGGGVALTHTMAAPQNRAAKSEPLPSSAEPPQPQNKKRQTPEDGPKHLLGTDDGKDVSVRLKRKTDAYDRIFQNALDVVDDVFEIAYANRYDGRIESKPKSEKPAASPPVRRRAIVGIICEDAGGYAVHFQVRKEAKITTTWFDEKISRQLMKTEWKFLGRDIELEQAMLKRFIEQDRKKKSSERQTAEINSQNDLLLSNVQLDAVDAKRTIYVTLLSNATQLSNLPVAHDAKIRVKGGNRFTALKIGRRVRLRLKVADNRLVVTEILQEGISSK